MGRLRGLWMLLAASCAPGVGFAAGSFDAHCGLLAERELDAIEFIMDGTQRQVRTSIVPAGAQLLAVISEVDVDVRIEASVGATQMPAVDSPLRRWGPQYLLIGAGPRRDIELAAIWKEGVKGKVRAQLFVVGGRGDDARCLSAYRALALADARYERGQAIAQGRVIAIQGALKVEYDAALARYDEAARLLRGAGPLAARTHLAIATMQLYAAQNYDEAQKAAKQAGQIFSDLSDTYARDRALAIEAGADIEIALAIPGRRKAGSAERSRTADVLLQARSKYTAIAKSHAQRGEYFDQALAQNNLGLAFYYADACAAAIRAYEPASAIYSRLGERVRHAQVQQNISLCYHELGRFREARRNFEVALRSFEPSQNLKLQGDILNNLALTERKSGLPDLALRHYADALDIFERLQNLREQARSLQGLGHTYYSTGNRGEALQYFERALSMRPAVRDATRNLPADPVGRLSTLCSIADTHSDAGRWAEAIALREQALALTDTPLRRTRILVALAKDSVDAGNFARAARALDEIFSADAGNDPVVYAEAVLQRARLHLAERRLEVAARDAQEAVALFRAKELSKQTFDAVLLQSQVACAAGNRREALLKVEESLVAAEVVRERSANPTMRTMLWQDLRAAFDHKIGMLAMPASCGGRPEIVDALSVLEVAEASRNRALAEYASMAASHGRGQLSEIEKRRRDLFDSLAELREQVDFLLENNGDADSNVAALRDDIARLQTEIDIIDARRGRPAPAKRTSKAEILRTAEMIPADTAVIEYWLGKEKSYAWLMVGGRVKMFGLGSTNRIDSAARAMHAALRDLSVSSQERVRRSAELHRLVIAPLGLDSRKTRTLYFVPDGTLHTVAFAALTASDGDSPRYLIDDFDLAVTATAAFVNSGGGNSRFEDARVLIVADPVYSTDDSRFSRPAERVARFKPPLTLRGGEARPRSRLPASAIEARTIGAMFDSNNVEVLTGFDASRNSLLGRDLMNYRVIHFATHAVADAEAPQLSALQLSGFDPQGNSRPGEVFAGDLLSHPSNAELLVLSACDTALGAQSAGEGLLGLRYAAHAGGARFVVASLWPVVDSVGAGLTTRMYEGMVRRGETPVVALSAAMRAARAKWRDPGLWAVFEVSHARTRVSVN